MRLLAGVLFLLSGCSDAPTDPVTMALFAKDGVLDTLERTFRPEAYWTKKVVALEKITSQARDSFQNLNQQYRAKLLAQREAVTLAVQEAKQQGKSTMTARNEAIQAHRAALAANRDEAREAGRELRVQLALLRRAQDFLEQAK